MLLDAIAEYRVQLYMCSAVQCSAVQCSAVQVQFYMCGLNHFIALANQEAGGRDLTRCLVVS